MNHSILGQRYIKCIVEIMKHKDQPIECIMSQLISKTSSFTVSQGAFLIFRQLSYWPQPTNKHACRLRAVKLMLERSNYAGISRLSAADFRGLDHHETQIGDEIVPPSWIAMSNDNPRNSFAWLCADAEWSNRMGRDDAVRHAPRP